MSKGGASQPAAPDPSETARQQGAINRDTAIAEAQLNRINQVTPWGTLNYDKGAKPDITKFAGVDGRDYWSVGEKVAGSLEDAQRLYNEALPTYTATTTLNPEQQKILNLQQQIGVNLNQLGVDQLGRISDAVRNPFSYSGMPSAVNNLDLTAAPGLRTNINAGVFGINNAQARTGTKGIVNAFDMKGLYGVPIPEYAYETTKGPVQAGLDRSGLPSLTTNVAQGQVKDGLDLASLPNLSTGASGGNIQSGLDYSSAPALMGTTALDAERTRIEDALFQRLNPQLQQDRTDLETQLANQGIMQGSQAYEDAFDRYNRGVNDARLAVIGQGGDELSRLFGISLSGRQQGVNELTTRGNFANQAQQQAYAQALANAQLSNTARAQGFGEQVTGTDIYNRAQDQRFQQGMQNAGLASTARGQLFGEEESAGQFANAAQQQAYDQSVVDAQLKNTSRQNALNEKLAMADLNNQAQQQDFSQQATMNQLVNAARAQALNEQQANAVMQNQGRERAIQEAAYLRDRPLQELASFMGTGGGPQLPQFVQTQPVQIQSPDLMGATYANYQGALQNSAQRAQQNAATTGGLFGLGSAAIIGGAIL